MDKNTHVYYDSKLADLDQLLAEHKAVLDSLYNICSALLKRVEALEAQHPSDAGPSQLVYDDMPSVAEQFKGQTVYGGFLPGGDA